MSFKSILHPTDFSEQSMVAFSHALKLAIEEKAKFIVMYVQDEDVSHLKWDKFPKVRDTLNKWGLIDTNANRKEIYEKLGVEVQKIIGKSKNIADSVAGIVHEEEIDLIVLSTKGAEGLPAWFNPSISESIARKSTVPTLFIPNDTKPFVDIESGELNLKKILIPVDHEPKPQRGVEFALNMGEIYGKGNSEIHIMHVLNKNNRASEEDLPELKVPDDEECVVRIELNNSSVTEEISKVSDEINADLIVIPTEGRRGFADALFGSTSERVIRHSKCPTLSIPVAIGKFLTRS